MIKKMFVPDQEGAGVKSNAKDSIFEVIAKLARINAYNNELQIRGVNGSYIADTNIGSLVAYSLKAEKIVKGQDQFVKLLAEAGIPRNVILNENVQQHMPPELQQMQEQPPEIVAHEPPRVIPQRPTPLLPPPPLLQKMMTQTRVARARDVEVRPENVPLPDSEDEGEDEVVVTGKRKRTGTASVPSKKFVYEAYQDEQ